MRGVHIDIAAAEQFLERYTLCGGVGMQWEVHPVDVDIEISLQLFNTPGTEVAPGSDEVGEYFKCEWFAHFGTKMGS